MISELEFNKQLLDLRPQLKVFASMLSLSDEDAEDLTQDTMIRAIANREKFTISHNIRAWLFTIMKNIFINSYRRNGNYREVIRKACNSGEYYYWSNDIVEDTDSSLYISELWNIVEKLEEKFRFPFICFLNGYKYKEIAELMSLPIGTIKSRIFYARKFLSEELVEF